MLVFLAPMAGVTDLPFRRLAYSFGAPATVTEMVACEDLAGKRAIALARAAIEPGCGPVIVQIAGREPYWFAEGARIATASGAEAIDLNFGCPAKKVTGGAGGAALMRDVDHAKRCVAAAVNATDKPLSVKMRLGWDEDNLNASQIAKAAEDEGATRVTIHGRTRNQFYTGSANWSAIRSIKDAVSAPVVANGDICSPDDASEALQQSGADGVMIGRAALGRPWLVAQVADRVRGDDVRAEPSPESVLTAVLRFYEESLEFYGRELGVRMARKHLSAFIDKLEYLGDAASRRSLRARICTMDDPAAVVRALCDSFLPVTRAAS
ncbi:MAG: tRNA dihydrouridine synthase DusB [Caulobacterales bacterium]